MPLWTQRVTGQARVLHGLVVEVILLPQIRCVGLLIIVDVLERFDLRADLLLVLRRPSSTPLPGSTDKCLND